MSAREGLPTTARDGGSVDAAGAIIDHLNLWTGAVTKKSNSGRGSNGKVELTGVKKLRELILELAVRGSLVDQNPSDESAQELLERCLRAKADSVEPGKLKKARKHASITSDDIPFDLPQRWVWSRLDDLVRVKNGRAYKKHEMLSSGTPLLRVGNLFTSNDWYYSDLELEEDKYIDSGDLIYAWSASFGPFIWDGGRAIYHYHIWKLDLFDGAAVDKRFLYLYLKAITEEIKSSGSGIAMIHMTKAKMEELIVPVPPLEEQHRIVQKVDELMALCDRLERQTSDQREAHETLVDTLLGSLLKPAEGSLTQSGKATELADNWARLAAHFDTLFTTEQSIDKLKQATLELAVRGKLVDQNPEDKPAQQFLELCLNAKSIAAQQGKLKKARKHVPITDDYVPFKLPKGWLWARLDDLVRVINGRAYKKHEMLSSGTPLLRVGNLFTSNEWYYSDLTLEDEKYIDDGDLIYAWSASFGPFIWEGGRAIYHYHIWKLDLFDAQAISKHFLYLYLRTITEEIKSSGSGIAMIHMTKSKMEELVFPFPPLEEQHRIVQKVDELMALCDRLKERLNQASETRCQLAETIVEGALQ